MTWKHPCSLLDVSHCKLEFTQSAYFNHPFLFLKPVMCFSSCAFWLTRPCDLQLHRQEVVNGGAGMRWAETGTPVSAVTINTPSDREEIISISCFAFHLSIRWRNTTKHKTETATFTCKRLSYLAYLESKKKISVFIFPSFVNSLILFQPCSV